MQGNQLWLHISSLSSINLQGGNLNKGIMLTTFPDGWKCPVFGICPLLLGAENWIIWNQRLRLMLSARDPQYWSILSGGYQRPKIDHQNKTTSETIKITTEQLEWDNKSSIILSIMAAIIDGSLSGYFRNRNAHHVYQLHRQNFQEEKCDMAFGKLETWLGYHYNSDMTPKFFVDLWRCCRLAHLSADSHVDSDCQNL
jgi:hypothetical protein